MSKENDRKSVLLGGIITLSVVLFIGIYLAIATLPPAEVKEDTTLTLRSHGKDCIHNDYMSVTVLSAIQDDHYITESDYREECGEGMQFIAVGIEVENLGYEWVKTGEGSFWLVDSEGYKYDTTSYYGVMSFPYRVTIYQHEKVKGIIIFEVLKHASSTSYTLKYDFPDTEETAKWKLKF